MNPPLFFQMLNCALAAVFAFVTVPLLIMFYEHLKITQRIGLALMSSGAVLWIPIFYMWPLQTPLSGWSTTLLLMGGIFYISDTVRRFAKHHWANIQQDRYYRNTLRIRKK